MTKIEWTDETWNPTTGCTKVSQGCKNCYAERLWPKVEAAERRREHFEWQKVTPRAFTEIRTHPLRLDAPLHWKKPRRVFVNSMSDLFHEDVHRDFVLRVFLVMARCPQHEFQILTKRPERMRTLITEWLPSAMTLADGPGLRAPTWPLPNVWLGVSVEDQSTADERIPLLLQTPAAVRFLSCEPLLGPIDLDKYIGEGYCPKREDNTHCVHWWDGEGEPCCGCKQIGPIDWVIAGGESGPKARPSHPDWFRSLRDQCAAAGVPFFFKQWGEWGPCETETHPDERGLEVWPLEESVLDAQAGSFDRRFKVIEEHSMQFGRFGKKLNGRTLDGREHNAYPDS
jgi:protein gp37